MNWKDMLFPKTGNYLLEGARLALLNAIFLVLGGGGSYALMWGAERLRGVGFPVPLPFWLIFMLLAGAYYIIWFQYGKAYGKFISRRRFIRGYIVGLIGQVPGLALMYFLLETRPPGLVVPELQRMGITISVTFNIVLPLMIALGALDQKKKSAS